jgi:uncharacterized protein (DUF1800 family)
VSFGPLPGQVEELAAGGVARAIESVLGAEALPPFDAPTKSDDDIATSWIKQMQDGRSCLAEKITWFWHGHFTSSVNQVDDVRMLYRQYMLLRRHALGDFRQMAQEITVDPAMLIYLNGDGSTGESPNENYGRELMELFVLGRGSYSQADVRAAARGLAGWSVQDGEAKFDPEAAHRGELTFLGRTGRFDARIVVDTVCDHPSCAPYIATRLHRYLAGAYPSPERRDQLARVFRDSGLNIGTLVAAILRHPSFLESRLNRPRYPVEWVTAATAALGAPASLEACTALGQVPFDPPNVAGWPSGQRWLAPGPALARASLAVTAPVVDEIAAAPDPVAAALARCSLYEVGATTQAALQRAAAATSDPAKRAAGLLALAVASPEFALA